MVYWFISVGKSTVANAVARKLFEKNIGNYVLDGDNIRHGLNKDLGFSESDRMENIRRIGEVAKLFVDQGTVVLTAFISPFRVDRKQVRDLLAADEFIEVFVNVQLKSVRNVIRKGFIKSKKR